MIQIDYMKPFYTKYSNRKLKVVFAYKYLRIKKDNAVYHFIPIEGKEIKIDTLSRQIENLSEVFVFQRGNEFIRLPLYQFLLISNVFEHLDSIIDKSIPESEFIVTGNDEAINNEELNAFVLKLEKTLLLNAIDRALDQRNEKEFHELVVMLHELYPSSDCREEQIPKKAS